jgi:hypothetical protein
VHNRSLAFASISPATRNAMHVEIIVISRRGDTECAANAGRQQRRGADSLRIPFSNNEQGRETSL